MCTICNKSKCSCEQLYTSALTFDGNKFVCNKGAEEKFTIRPCDNLNKVLATFAEELCELWNEAVSNNYVENVVLNATSLDFTGIGLAFNGSIDLSSINTDTIDYVSNVALNGSSLDFTGVGNGFNSSVDLSSLAGSDTTLYDRDGTLTGQRRADLNAVNIAFVGTYSKADDSRNRFGIGMEPNLIGVSTEAGGQNSNVQFHVAGPMRTDNWYHGKYGLLLHQPIDSTNLGVGLNAATLIESGTGNIAIGKQVIYKSDTTHTVESNVAIGNFAIGAGGAITGIIRDNVAVGGLSLGSLQEGINNVVVGDNAGNALERGDNNVIIGYLSGAAIPDLNGCTIVGRNGANDTTPTASPNHTNMTMYGANTTIRASGLANVVAIGYGVAAYETSTIVLGTANTKMFFGYGQYDSSGTRDYQFSPSWMRPDGVDETTGANGITNGGLTGAFDISGGSGTGTGQGRTMRLGAHLPGASGTANNPFQEFLNILGTATVDQTTNVQIVFDNVGTLTTRKIEVGAPDSGGAGYRQLRILN